MSSPRPQPTSEAASATRSDRVDRRVQEFRTLVLTTAEELFAERGVEATKIDDICAAADVAKRTLSNHFPTKAHIVQALSREAVSRMVSLVDDARREGGSTRERLELFFARFFAGAEEIGPVHRETAGAFFGAAHGTPDATEGEIRVSDAIQALLREGGTEELPPGCSVETFAEIVQGAVYAMTLEWIHREDYDIERRIDEVARFLTGLLPVD